MTMASPSPVSTVLPLEGNNNDKRSDAEIETDKLVAKPAASAMVAASPESVVMHPTRNYTQPPPGPAFHPDFMFCGACTECHAPDTAAVEEEDSEHALEELHDENAPSQSLYAADRLQTLLELQHPWKSPHHKLVIESLLTPITGVSSVLVDARCEQTTVTIHHTAQTAPPDLLRVLQQGGYPATVAKQLEHDSATRDELMNDDNSEELVRSSFFVQGICCASELPSIRRIVKPIPGVSTLQINITTRRVYVQHDCKIVNADEIAQVLTRSGFPAKLLQDGGAAVSVPQTKGTVGRSTLQAERLLHKQDIPRMQTLFSRVVGVKRVGVNLNDSVVHVEHDFVQIPAVDLMKHLDEPYKLIQDAAAIAQQEQNEATALLFGQARSSFVETCLQISNLTTNRHVTLLYKIISQQYIRSAVRAVHPHVSSRTVKIEHQPDKVTAAQLVSTLQRYGLDASILTDGGVERHYLPLTDSGTTPQEEQAELAAKEAIENWQFHQLQWHVILSGIFWVVSLLSAVEGWSRLEYAGLLSVAFGLPGVALKALRTVRRGEFDANGMMVVAAIGALVLGELDEAASVSFLFAVSEFLEARATARARRALADICQLRPERANLLHPETKDMVIVPADQVPVGSLISVRTGDKIAADGIVVEGSTVVDESSLTGESAPVRKVADDSVAGGSINIGNVQLVVRTTSTAQDSTVSRLIRLVEEAQANRSPTEKMIDGFARAYTPVVIGLALLMATIPWFVGGNEVGRHWTMNALIIIVIACPCALTISTPVTYAAGLAATARRGIVVKGGASLEALGSVDTVVLDKTGTITEGKFAVQHLELVGDERTREEMLKILALMEGPSSHPMSATLVRAAKKEGVSVPRNASVQQHSILKGEGVTAIVNGKNTYVGNRRLFERIGMYDNLGSAYKHLAEDWSAEGGTVGFLGIEGEGIIGSFSMIDLVRDEARGAIGSLHKLGLQVLMLTGDGDGAAKAVAKQVGILDEEVHSQLLPEDKLHFVGSLKRPAPRGSFGLLVRQPRVMFVGDGVNDGPALAVADIGVSMGEGAALAMEMSDVTLMDSNLDKIPYIVQMGSRVMRTIQENIFMSLGCKLLVVAFTFWGKMTLLYAIASDVGVMLLVTLNGMKLLPGLSDDSELMEDASELLRPLKSSVKLGEAASTAEIV